MSPDELRDCVVEELRSAGLKQRGRHWYLHGADAIAVAELQKSRWGNQFHLNLAVWLNLLGEKAHPREPECHIRTRLGGIGPQVTDAALNLDSTLSEVERRKRLSALLREHAIPFLQRCSSLEGARAVFREGLLRNALIVKEARAVLE